MRIRSVPNPLRDAGRPAYQFQLPLETLETVELEIPFHLPDAAVPSRLEHRGSDGGDLEAVALDDPARPVELFGGEREDVLVPHRPQFDVGHPPLPNQGTGPVEIAADFVADDAEFEHAVPSRVQDLTLPM